LSIMMRVNEVIAGTYRSPSQCASSPYPPPAFFHIGSLRRFPAHCAASINAAALRAFGGHTRPRLLQPDIAAIAAYHLSCNRHSRIPPTIHSGERIDISVGISSHFRALIASPMTLCKEAENPKCCGGFRRVLIKFRRTGSKQK